MFSSRNPEGLKDLVTAAGPNAKAGTVAGERALLFGDVVLIVVPYTAVEQIAKDYSPALAAKQLVIDVSNPIARRDGEEFVKKINDQGGAGNRGSQDSSPGGASGARLQRDRLGWPREAPRTARARRARRADRQRRSQGAAELAAKLIKDIGFEAVLVGGMAKGKYLVPGTPLGGEHTPDEIRKIAATLA